MKPPVAAVFTDPPNSESKPPGETSGPGGAARAWEHAREMHIRAAIEHAANERLLEQLAQAERELAQHKAALAGCNTFLAELAQLRILKTIAEELVMSRAIHSCIGGTDEYEALVAALGASTPAPPGDA